MKQKIAIAALFLFVLTAHAQNTHRRLPVSTIKVTLDVVLVPVNAARSAASTFLQIGNPRDEYFLVEFNDHPQIMQDFTSDVQMLQETLISQKPQERTAFMDAVYVALGKPQTR